MLFWSMFSLGFMDAFCSNPTAAETSQQKSSPLIKMRLSKSLFKPGRKIEIYDPNYFEKRRNADEERSNLELENTTSNINSLRRSNSTLDLRDAQERPVTTSARRRNDTSERSTTTRSRDQQVDQLADDENIPQRRNSRFLDEEEDLSSSDTRSYTSRTSTRRLANDTDRRSTTTNTRIQLDDNLDDDLLADSYVHFAEGLRKPEELGENPKLTDILAWMSDNINYIYLYPQDEMNSQKVRINLSEEKDDTIKHSADIFSILNDNEIQNIVRKTRRAINAASQHIRNRNEYGTNEIEYYCHLMQVITDAMKAYTELRMELNLKFIAVSTISVPNVDESLLHIIYTQIFTTILGKIKTTSDIRNVINFMR